MSHILLLERDSALRSPLIAALFDGGHTVAHREHVEDSLRDLEHLQFDILLSELSAELGLPVLRALRKTRNPPIPIVITADSSSVHCEEAERLGAVQVLKRPVGSEQILGAIRRAEDFHHGFRGRVHGVSLVDLLQMFHYSRRSVSLSISNRGQVDMSNGEVIHAAFDDVIGEDALRDILLLESGVLRTEPLASVTATIQRSFQSLLLDALRACDESEREPQILPATVDDPFGFGDLLDSMSPPEIIRSLPPPVTPRSPSLPAMSHLLTVACAQLVRQVEQGIGAAVVDLQHSRILGMHWVPGNIEPGVLLAGALGMLQSDAMLALHRAMNPHAETTDTDLTEFRAASDCALYFAKRLTRSDVIVVLVVARGANPGICWAEMRRCLPAIERALP